MAEQSEATESLARRLRIAVEAADPSAFGDLLDPSVRLGAPEDLSPPCQNRAQVLSWYRRARDAGVRIRVSEVVVLGDRAILVGMSVTRDSPAPAVERWQVMTVAGGRVVEIAGYEERSEAVASAVGGSAPSVVRWAEPRRALTDDRIELRLPDLSDAETLRGYASQKGGLEGIWVPLAEGATLAKCEELIGDWRAGWANLPSVQGPALVIVEAGGTQLIGQVGFRDRSGGVVEIVYGVAPRHRGRGYASRAAGLVACWLLADRLAREVELRIGGSNVESQRVAAAAGFLLAGSVISQVEATGETYDDLRYVMAVVEPCA